MRESRDPSGRMPCRLYYEESEIDAIMEDEFRRAGKPRFGSGDAVDVDAFIENHLNLTPQFVPLPAGVQGATDFFPDGRAEMRICESLSTRAGNSEPGAENLIRTTLAHEAAHYLLHRLLFLKQTEDLFGGQASRRELCRDIRPVAGYSGEWWEWQANRGMGALLLPKSEMLPFIRANRDGIESGDVEFIRAVAKRYAVSTQVVRFRFDQLMTPTHRDQMSWEFE